MSDDPERAHARGIEEALRVVRVGHGANCSSIGSVIDTLFVTAVAGGAIFAAIAAALATEPVREIARKTEEAREPEESEERP